MPTETQKDQKKLFYRTTKSVFKTVKEKKDQLGEVYEDHNEGVGPNTKKQSSSKIGSKIYQANKECAKRLKTTSGFSNDEAQKLAVVNGFQKPRHSPFGVVGKGILDLIGEYYDAFIYRGTSLKILNIELR
jgi:hypothetical protein